MHSNASRASAGTTSASRGCVEPKRSFMKEERKEPNASEANSGTVIIYLLRATSVSTSARSGRLYPNRASLTNNVLRKHRRARPGVTDDALTRRSVGASYWFERAENLAIQVNGLRYRSLHLKPVRTAGRTQHRFATSSSVARSEMAIDVRSIRTQPDRCHSFRHLLTLSRAAPTMLPNSRWDT